MAIGTARRYSGHCTKTISKNGDPLFGSQLKEIMALNLMLGKMTILKVKGQFQAQTAVQPLTPIQAPWRKKLTKS